jgi:hypothetical protein
VRKNLFVLLSVSLAVGGSSGADTTPSVSQVLRFIIERPDDRMRRALLLGIGAELVERSATFSDLLGNLREARHVLLYLRFVQLRQVPPSGRTLFEIAPSGLVVGFIEIDPALVHPLSRDGAIVAHELAHAYEVSCLPHIRSTEELLRTLRERAASQNGGNSAETPFAAAVEKAVIDEWYSGERIASQLPALAAKYDLNRCVSAAPQP